MTYFGRRFLTPPPKTPFLAFFAPFCPPPPKWRFSRFLTFFDRKKVCRWTDPFRCDNGRDKKVRHSLPNDASVSSNVKPHARTARRRGLPKEVGSNVAVKQVNMIVPPWYGVLCKPETASIGQCARHLVRSASQTEIYTIIITIFGLTSSLSVLFRPLWSKRTFATVSSSLSSLSMLR